MKYKKYFALLMTVIILGILYFLNERLGIIKVNDTMLVVSFIILPLVYFFKIKNNN